MHSLIRTVAVALGVGGATTVATMQQAPVKVGYVNTQTLLSVAPGRAAAESILTRESNSLGAQAQKMMDSINGLIAKYQKEQATLTPAARDKSQKTIQTLSNDYQAKQAQFQQRMQQREAEVMAPISELVKRVIGDIREEGSYSVIFGAEAIVSADKNLDVTDKVVSRLRATPAPKPGAPPAAKKP